MASIEQLVVRLRQAVAAMGVSALADAELPLDEVRAAVLEYVRTGERPTCVDWQASE